MKNTCLLTTLLWMLSFPLTTIGEEKVYVDERTVLPMTAAEKAEFLREMRQMLASIQGIMSGIATENREQIIASARYSGNRMARATPDSVRQKLPQEFRQIGGPTHMLFEEVVVRAETDDMEDIAELTGTLMKNCLECHDKFRVTTIEQ